MIDLRILLKLISEFGPPLLAAGFFVSAYLEDDHAIRALYMLIATMWMVISKLDDIHTKIVHRKLVVEVHNPPGITSRVEVNGKQVN